MASSQLPNYLQTHRKRVELSQDEVAYLLGTECGTKVSRYELFSRDPLLRTALAYEVIFQRPIRELFAGLYDEIEREVAERARTLALKTGQSKLSPRDSRKRQMLAMIATVKPKNHDKKYP